MVACSETLTAEDKVKGHFAHTDPRAGDNNIPNGTTDACWFGWQTMEERNSSNTATCQYVWGNYLDECIQINLLQPAGPQQLAIGVYYPLQDTLYRTMALANSSGTPVEAYDTDAYGNTIIFTGPGADNTWFTDDDTQSSYGANSIIYCGYRYDAETGNYYVRNRYYSPTLGRWLTRDSIGYSGGINLYGYVNSSPVGNMDAEGLAGQFIPGRGTFSIQVKGEPSIDTGWAEAHVRVHFVPASLLMNKRQCLCSEIGLVQVANTTYVAPGWFGLSQTSEGWHLDSGEGNQFSTFLNKPYFGGSTPWLQRNVGGPPAGGGQYAWSSDDPEDTSPFGADSELQHFKIYAICVHGEERGDSYGYLAFAIRWFTSGPLGMLGTVQVANPGASPGFGVIVKGQMNQAGLGAWAMGWGGAAPHPIDKYFQFGWARAIKPLPGENWLAS